MPLHSLTTSSKMGAAGSCGSVFLPSSVSRPTLISCIFCNFEMAFDAALSQGGYIQHLQGWHHITLQAEVERAMMLALKIKDVGDEAAGLQKGDEAVGDEHDARSIVVTVENSDALKAPSEDITVIKAEKGAVPDARNVINRLKRKKVKSDPVNEQPSCDKCGKKFGKDIILQDHMRAAHGAPRLFCGGLGCNSQQCFLSLHSYNDHVIKVHHGEKGFECPYRECEQKFVLGERGDHLRLAHGAPGLKCKHCNGRAFKRQADRKSHMRAVHSGK